MRKIAIILVLLISAGFLFGQTKTVTINRVPASADAFLELRDALSGTPEGGAAMMILALLIYSRDQELGRQCLVIAVDINKLITGMDYKGYQLNKWDLSLIESQFKKQIYIPRTYFKGATPENDYAVPDEGLALEFSSNSYSGNPDEGQFKVFIHGMGADSPRPITVTRNDRGIWKASEWSSLVVGVKKMKSEQKIDDI